MESSVIYNIQEGPYWDWKVAVDLFLGGAGVGALLFAVLLDQAFKGRYRRICQTAAWLSPTLVIAGLLFLLFKLGRPMHLPLTYLHFAPTSPLWWGGIFQPLLILGSLWYALKWVSAESDDPGRRRLGWALAPLALIVGGYHGLLLSVITARPLWSTGPTVVTAILGFMATGIAAVMLIHLLRMGLAGRLRNKEHLSTFLDDMRCVRNVLVATLVLQIFTFFLWWLSLNFGTLEDKHALAAANAAYGPLFWIGGIGVGAILPLGVGGLAVWIGEASHRRLQVSAIALTSGMILVGGFFFRLAVVLGGQVRLPVTSLF
jgi:protein NrfD